MKPKLKQAPINSTPKSQPNLPKKQFVQDHPQHKPMTRKPKPKFVPKIIESDEDEPQDLKSVYHTPSQNLSNGSYGSPLLQPSQLTNHTSCNSSQKGRRESRVKKRQDKSRLKKEQQRRKNEKEDKKTLALLAEYERQQSQRLASQTQWERIEKQQFKPLSENDKAKLNMPEPHFLESWDGFSPFPIEVISQFAADFNPEVLSLGQEFNPDEVALRVLLSFAFHFDNTLLLEKEERVDQLREQIRKFEAAKKMAKQEDEKELLKTQTKSQIWRLLNMSLNGAQNQDILYRRGDEVEEGCHVCFNIEESVVNQIVLCNKCGLRVHQSCYGIRLEQIQTFVCNRCEFLEKQLNVERKFKQLFEAKQDKSLKSRDERLKNFYFNSVPCSICGNAGGAMVRNSETQEWIHVLCVLLNSHKYYFKDIENIRNSAILKHKTLKAQVQQSSPSYSNSTLASTDYESCQLCDKGSGFIVRVKNFAGHLMCALLKGCEVKVQRREDGTVEATEVIIPKCEEERRKAAEKMQSLYCVSEKCPEVVWEDY